MCGLAALQMQLSAIRPVRLCSVQAGQHTTFSRDGLAVEK